MAAAGPPPFSPGFILLVGTVGVWGLAEGAGDGGVLPLVGGVKDVGDGGLGSCERGRKDGISCLNGMVARFEGARVLQMDYRYQYVKWRWWGEAELSERKSLRRGGVDWTDVR